MENKQGITKMAIVTEVLNASTHGIGVILGIVGLVLLIYKNMVSGASNYLVANIIFGVCFIALFLFSTLYHSLSFTKAKKIMRRFDHSAIFLMIAGSYTPYCLISLNTTASKWFLIAIWTLAIIGIVVKNFIMNAPAWVSAAIYLVMGWMSVIMLHSLTQSIQTLPIVLLIAGGVTYSVGTIFYCMKKWPMMHVIWHLFVLVGAVLIYISIYNIQ